MKNILFLFVFISSIFYQIYGQSCVLQNGDLLFQVNKSSQMVDAIQESTAKNKHINYTHVGIVCKENDSIFVIEATTPVVSKTELNEFLQNSNFLNEKPMVSVARLKKKYQKKIKMAEIIEKSKQYIGKPYDYQFSPNNDAYYCTELVYLCYQTTNKKPLFFSKPMTFKNKNGQFSSSWIAYFENLHLPIPEGELGTNPEEMSQSKVLKFIFHFFD